MRTVSFLFLLIIIAWFFTCSDSTGNNKNLATLTGAVYGIELNNQLVPIEGALVNVENYFSQATSNTSGVYQLQVELSSDNATNLKVVATKAGYIQASATVAVKKGETVQVPDLTLQKMVNDTTGTDTTGQDTSRVSGDAAHIEVFGAHEQHIYVLGSGLPETALLRFVVRDANGVPVDKNHRVLVEFSVLNGPGGGEFVDPDTMTTQGGLVYTVLNSGVVSGPVQIQAKASVNGNVISTIPVRVAIYGGLPDAVHFNLAADRLNIAGLKFSGIIDYITAFVGDKYSNPVAPGTVVYFSSDYCIVDGSAQTDEMGRATVRFMSTAPLPPSPQDSAFAHITGWTYSDLLQENSIKTRARVLLTDQTAPIMVSPTSFSYTNQNVPVNFTYTVQDVWGRPLVADSKIKVSATDGDVYGDTDITTQDTQASGPGLTQFSFTWSPGDSLQAPQVYINIKVTTPANGNGYQSVDILGNKQ